MEKKSNESEVLNDLLKINNDRVEGYEKAADESKEQDQKRLFHDMADESKTIVMALTQEILKLDGEPAVGSTTNAGKIYRVWMDIRATFNGKNREGILSACEFGEDAAQSAYKTALESGDLSPNSEHVISAQKTKLKASLDLIKQYRERSVVA
jgi:uncharacterized protein (TIGR02284 family)